MEGMQLMIQEQGLMICAVPDGKDGEVLTGVGREVGKWACKQKGKEASQPKSTTKCA